MSAFEDYCIVCERVCDLGAVYCSEKCKEMDKLSPLNPGQGLQPSGPLSSVVSPLLTPQVNPRRSVVDSLLSPRTHASIHQNLSYKSPFLGSSNPLQLDLDNNSLDLNISKSSIPKDNVITSRRSSHVGGSLGNHPHSIIHHSHSHAHAHNNKDNKISNISDILSKSTSENYKKWLSTHWIKKYPLLSLSLPFIIIKIEKKNNIKQNIKKVICYFNGKYACYYLK